MVFNTTFNRNIDFDFWCFNATFSNISTISWQPVLVVEEAGVPGQATSKFYHLRLRVECNFVICNFVIYKAGRVVHAELVIGLYELLGNPTT